MTLSAKTTSEGLDIRHPKYRPDIDGLRAIAVLAVVGFHAFPFRIPGGFIGVDVFFVISGYLISTILFENLDARTFSFTDFYARRIRRIFPALLVVLVACIAVGWFALLPAEYGQLGKHIAGASVFVSNFMFWHEAGYFDTLADTKPLLHLWSLGIEEQFYIVWPLLVWGVWKLRLNVLTVICLLLSASFLLSAVVVRTDTVVAFYSPQTRFWELLAGSLLAWIHIRSFTVLGELRQRVDHLLRRVIFSDVRNDEFECEVWANTLAILGAVLIVTGVFVLSRHSPFPGPNALMPVAGAFLLISAGSGAWLNKRVLSHKLLVWVGLISYPLYLWHWPLLSIARIIEGRVPGVWIRISAVVLAFFLSWLTYRLIELPIRRGRCAKSCVFSLVMLMAVVGYVGYNIYSRDGYDFRSHIRTFVAANKHLEWLPSYDADDLCRKHFVGYGYCKIDQDRSPTVALIGDSFANAYFFGLAEQFARKKDNLVMLGAAGCPPLLNVTSGPTGQGDWCHNQTANALKAAATDPDIHTVILAANWHLYVDGHRFGPMGTAGPLWRLRSIGGAEQEKNADAFAAQLVNTIELLQAAGKKVIVLKQTPELDYLPVECFGKRPVTISEQLLSCEIPVETVRKYLAGYEDVMNAVMKKFPGITVWDPFDYFCDARNCFSMLDGKPLYRDNLHLSVYGSGYLARKLINE